MSESQGNGIPAAPLIAAALGAVLLWSGVKGKSISQSFRSILEGQNPENATQVTAIVGSDTGPASPADPISTGNSVFNEQVPSGSNIGTTVVQYVEAQLGKPYVFATSGPNSFDCSGLTAAGYQAAGISIPHNSLLQWNTCQRVQEADLQPGDIIFYYDTVHHCAIYVGLGQLVEASEPGVPVHQIPVYNNAQNPIHGYGRYTHA